MWRKFYLAFAVAVIGGMILSITEVDAQSTVDDSASSCESPTRDEELNLIREDLKDVKNILRSNQQQNNASSISKKDLEDIKAACALNQQPCPQTELSSSKQVVAVSFLCEYTLSTRILHIQ